MRILQVRFKNLNSLSGEWSIDFTHSAYASDGIFAITGPTGAGKTTILDAVCLALYGRTPRLNRVTKGSNEIMSRQSGECFAEVSFETQTGRFRCHWSQHRARKKSDGDLQNPKHEISDMDTGKILEANVRGVADKIESVTGMDFDRFTRSMLLAQGGFAAFLQAGPDERAPILEQITGTEIYSRISIKVHERWGEEHKKLQMLQAELAGIRLLSVEEEQKLHDGLEEKRALEAETAKHVEGLNKAAAWLDGIAGLEKELAAVEELWSVFERKREFFEPERKRLEDARRVMPLEGEYAGIVLLRRQQQTDGQAVREVAEKVPARQTALNAAHEAVRTAGAQRGEKRDAQRDEAEIIKKIRELDLRIREKRVQADGSAETLKQAGKEIATRHKVLLQTGKRLEKSRVALPEIEHFLAGNAADAGLIAKLAAIEKTFGILRNTWEKHNELLHARSDAGKENSSAGAALSELEAAAERQRAEVAEAERMQVLLEAEISGKLHGRELSDRRNDLDALRERSQMLEQAFQKLEDISAVERRLEELRSRRHGSVGEKEKLDGEIRKETGKLSQGESKIADLDIRVGLLRRIMSLEEERSRLEDGRPCPLCGATEHPYARGNVPELNAVETELQHAREEAREVSGRLSALRVAEARINTEIEQAAEQSAEMNRRLEIDRKQCGDVLESLRIDAAEDGCRERVLNEMAAARDGIAQSSGLIREIESLEKKRNSAREALEKIRRLLVRSDRNLQTAVHRKTTAERELERAGRECGESGALFAEVRAEAVRELEPFGIREFTTEGLPGLLNDLARRRDTWQETQGRKADLEREIASLEAEREKQKSILERLDEEFGEKSRADRGLHLQLDALIRERYESYGTKDAAEEERRFARAVEQAEKALEVAGAEQNRIEQELTELRAKKAMLEAAIANRAEGLCEAEGSFRVLLARTGFEDEVAYLRAVMPEKERAELNLKAESLQREQTGLDTRRRDKAALLSEERRRMVTEKNREEVRCELEGGIALLREIQQSIGAVRQQLAENRDLRVRQQERIRAIESRQAEFARWDSLHELIGSADGKKFRNFAQGLTFEIMVAHANRQLRKMTDRYLLIRDRNQPLELNVMDSYQAGEIRSTKNLSGGESFIVSLSLALGLSQISSRNVRVDSLFLDEGFGTLDEEALETALETLAGLQQDGKTIGVISHVQALRERIGTQIRVIPRTGGRSIILGPGCRSGDRELPSEPE